MAGISLSVRSPLAVLSLLCAGYAVSFFHRVCPAVLSVDLMRDFSLDAASFSLISSSTMLGYALTQIPSGMLADVIGGRKTLALYQVLAVLLCMAFTCCDLLASAVSCRFLLGLTLAANIPAYKILALRVPSRDYARYSAVLTCSGAVGTLMAASPLVALTDLAGWRGALFMAGAFTVLLGFALLILLRRPSVGEAVRIPSIRENVRSLKEGAGVVLRMKQFWLIFLWFMFVIGNMFALVTMWWGGYLMQANGLSREAAGLSISIMSLGPLPLVLVVPWLSDNVFRSRRVFLLAAALLESAAFGFIWLNGDSPLPFAALTALGLMVTVSTNALGTLCFTMVKECVPVSALASACGLLNASGPVMAAVVQSVFGAVVAWRTAEGCSNAAAYGDAFAFLFAGSLVAVGAALFMKDTLDRGRDRD